MAYSNVKCRFVYTTKKRKYERTFLSEKYAHHVTRYGGKEKYSPMMMSSPHHTI